MYLHLTACLGVFFSNTKYTWVNLLSGRRGGEEVGEECPPVSQCTQMEANFLLSLSKGHFKHRLLHIEANSTEHKD